MKKHHEFVKDYHDDDIMVFKDCIITFLEIYHVLSEKITGEISRFLGVLSCDMIFLHKLSFLETYHEDSIILSWRSIIKIVNFCKTRFLEHSLIFT